MKNIQGCIFDYGNTLVQESAFDCYKGMENIMNYIVKNPFSVTAESLTNLSLKIDNECGRKRGYIERCGDIEYPQYISLKYIFEYYQLEFNCSFDEIEAEFWFGATKMSRIQDADFMLRILQDKGIRLGVISNISFSQYALSKRLQLAFPDIRFHLIISSATIGFRKPHPAIYDLAWKIMGIEKGKILYVGDQFDKDVVGAEKYGMKAMLFGNSNITEDNNVQYTKVTNWKQFLEYIE